MAKAGGIPVLIVGGRGAGLTPSMLLGTDGIESLLVSALPMTSTFPEGHVLNQRAMEAPRPLRTALTRVEANRPQYLRPGGLVRGTIASADGAIHPGQQRHVVKGATA